MPFEDRISDVSPVRSPKEVGNEPFTPKALMSSPTTVPPEHVTPVHGL